MLPESPAAGYGCATFPINPRLPSAREIEPPSPVRSDWRLSRLDVDGDIQTDTVWDADTVRVNSNVTVLDGTTLTIAAGTLVEFEEWFALSVEGCLLALGEADAPVRFDSDEPDAFAFDSTTTGAWAGIRFPFTRETNAASRLEYCVIEHAKNAGDSCRGGALQINGFGKLSIENTILRANAADFGGAIACTHYASPRITGCLIAGNVAFWGGAAMHCLDSYPRLLHCTITANQDRNPNIFDPAAAIYSHLSKPAFAGGILWGNSSHYFEPTQILYGKSYYTSYSDIGDGWKGEGIIDKDPHFLSAQDHPFALASNSPCIDRALPDTTGIGLPSFDLLGSPRLWNARGDMGGYEWDPGTAVPIEILRGLPKLALNYPNPFNPSTTLRFTLAKSAPVNLSVFDPVGRCIRVLREGVVAAGEHRADWDGNDAKGNAMPSGIYLARLTVAGAPKLSVKMLLAK